MLREVHSSDLFFPEDSSLAQHQRQQGPRFSTWQTDASVPPGSEMSRVSRTDCLSLDGAPKLVCGPILTPSSWPGADSPALTPLSWSPAPGAGGLQWSLGGNVLWVHLGELLSVPSLWDSIAEPLRVCPGSPGCTSAQHRAVPGSLGWKVLGHGASFLGDCHWSPPCRNQTPCATKTRLPPSCVTMALAW